MGVVPLGRQTFVDPGTISHCDQQQSTPNIFSKRHQKVRVLKHIYRIASLHGNSIISKPNGIIGAEESRAAYKMVPQEQRNISYYNIPSILKRHKGSGALSNVHYSVTTVKMTVMAA